MSGSSLPATDYTHIADVEQKKEYDLRQVWRISGDPLAMVGAERHIKPAAGRDYSSLFGVYLDGDI